MTRAFVAAAVLAGGREAAAAPAPVIAPLQSAFAKREFGEHETDRCLECHGLPMLFAVDSLGRLERSESVDAPGFRRSVHAAVACTDCHPGVRAYPHDFGAGRTRVSCDADCHASDARGSTVRHTQAAADVRQSVHAEGLTPWTRTTDLCLGCHGGDPHVIPRASPHAPPSVRLRACVPCHADAMHMRDAHVEPSVVESYALSFHGKAERLGATGVAVCADCHGAHLARSPRDSASTVFAANLPKTCGRADCHPGAGPRFATSGANHPSLRIARDPWLRGLAGGFAAAGAAVVLALGGIALMDAQRRFAPGPRPEPEGRAVLVERLSLAQRLQHGALVGSFAALAVSGLPMRFPDSAPIAAMAARLGGTVMLRAVHRGAAVVLVAAALAHAVYLLVLLARARGDVQRAWPMVPGRQDVREAFDTLRWALRRREAAPEHGRHEFRAKLHYAAVLWGVPVMALSGLVLWFPVYFGNPLPGRALALAQIVHGDEALVAIAVVVLWHLYNVHVLPGAHHRFGTWIDGRVTAGWWRAFHAREARASGGVTPVPARPRSPLEAAEPLLLAGILVVALLFRVREASRTPLWFDEIFTLFVARRPLPETFALLPLDIHPPLPTLLVSLWVAIAGGHPLWLRTLPILVGLATIVATAVLGRALFGRAAGLLAAALLALHPSHIYFSQELRGYGLLAFALTVAGWGAWKWAERGRLRHAAAWVAGADVALHTHYLAGLVAALLSLGVLPAAIRDKRLRGWFGAQAVLALVASPLLRFLPEQLRLSRSNWIPHPPLLALADLARKITFGAWYLVPVLGLLAALPLLLGRRRDAARFAWWCALAPILLTFAITQVGPHLFVGRYMYFTLPFWCSLLAGGLVVLPWRAARPYVTAALLALAVRADFMSAPHVEAVALRDVAQSLGSRMRAGDLLLCADTHSLVTLDLHLHSQAGRLVMTEPDLPYYLGRVMVDSTRFLPVDRVESLVAGRRRWWGVYTRDGSPSTATAAAKLDSLARGGRRRFGMVTVWAGEPGMF